MRSEGPWENVIVANPKAWRPEGNSATKGKRDGSWRGGKKEPDAPLPSGVSPSGPVVL